MLSTVCFRFACRTYDAVSDQAELRGHTIESGARHTITRKQSSEESVASGTAIPARSPD